MCKVKAKFSLIWCDGKTARVRTILVVFQEDVVTDGIYSRTT